MRIKRFLALALSALMMVGAQAALSEDTFTHPDETMEWYYYVSDLLNPDLREARDTQILAQLEEAVTEEYNLYASLPEAEDMSWFDALPKAVEALEQKYDLTAEEVDALSVWPSFMAEEADNPYWHFMFMPTDQANPGRLDMYVVLVYSRTGETSDPSDSGDSHG